MARREVYPHESVRRKERKSQSEFEENGFASAEPILCRKRLHQTIAPAGRVLCLGDGQGLNPMPIIVLVRKENQILRKRDDPIRSTERAKMNESRLGGMTRFAGFAPNTNLGLKPTTNSRA